MTAKSRGHLNWDYPIHRPEVNRSQLRLCDSCWGQYPERQGKVAEYIRRIQVCELSVFKLNMGVMFRHQYMTKPSWEWWTWEPISHI
jgi:hypothetical protein